MPRPQSLNQWPVEEISKFFSTTRHNIRRGITELKIRFAQVHLENAIGCSLAILKPANAAR